jgi:hypothetical protein
MNKVQSGRVTKSKTKQDPRRYYYVTCVFSSQLGQLVVVTSPLSTITIERVPLGFVFWTTAKSLTSDFLETSARPYLTTEQASFQLTTMTVLEITRTQYGQVSKQMETNCQRISDKIVLLPK